MVHWQYSHIKIGKQNLFIIFLLLVLKIEKSFEVPARSGILIARRIAETHPNPPSNSHYYQILPERKFAFDMLKGLVGGGGGGEDSSTGDSNTNANYDNSATGGYGDANPVGQMNNNNVGGGYEGGKEEGGYSNNQQGGYTEQQMQQMMQMQAMMYQQMMQQQGYSGGQNDQSGYESSTSSTEGGYDSNQQGYSGGEQQGGYDGGTGGTEGGTAEGETPAEGEGGGENGEEGLLGGLGGIASFMQGLGGKFSMLKEKIQGLGGGQLGGLNVMGDMKEMITKMLVIYAHTISNLTDEVTQEVENMFNNIPSLGELARLPGLQKIPGISSLKSALGNEGNGIRDNVSMGMVMKLKEEMMEAQENDNNDRRSYYDDRNYYLNGNNNNGEYY